MIKASKYSKLLAAMLLAAWAQGATAASGHVHGQAELEVAVEGSSLTVTLRSPLDNLLGFERAPRTASQKAAADALVQRLREPAALFKPSPAAKCSPVSTEIEAPVLGLAAPASGKAAGAKQGQQDAHAELVAVVRFSCERVDQLLGLEAMIFEQYRRLHRIDARVAGPRGQSSARLTAARRSLNW